MQQDGWTLSEQHPDFLRYGIGNDKLSYLVDFTFFNVIDPDEDDIIIEDNVYVLSFNIWPGDLREASE